MTWPDPQEQQTDQHRADIPFLSGILVHVSFLGFRAVETLLGVQSAISHLVISKRTRSKQSPKERSTNAKELELSGIQVAISQMGDLPNLILSLDHNKDFF